MLRIFKNKTTLTRYLILAVILFLKGLNIFGQTEKIEILNMDSILINNRVPFQTTTKNLKENFGKPDSITTLTHECGGYFENTVSVYYYGQTVFEAYKDTVVIRKINFINEHFNIKTTQFTLNSNTTLNYIKQFFPSSVDNSFDWTNPVDNKTYRLVKVLPKKDYDDQWVLKFYNGRLVEIEYWIPC